MCHFVEQLLLDTSANNKDQVFSEARSHRRPNVGIGRDDRVSFLNWPIEQYQLSQRAPSEVPRQELI
jgi:hypothetical protein